VKATLPKGIYSSIVDETVLRPGEENPVLQVQPSETAPGLANQLKRIDVLEQISFRVCYCSVLDQCWINDLRSTRTLAVGQCRRPEHPYDPNGH
jgi:hypothetical protein